MNNQRIDEILKKLNDNREKLTALYSLYNSSILTAETDRQSIGEYYDKMIDLKSDIAQLKILIEKLSKKEREDAITKNRNKIKTFNADTKQVNDAFNTSYKNYSLALKDCGNLKSEYKSEVVGLCKEFKALKDAGNVDSISIKGYTQQVRIIKVILDRIETLIADYNVKKNKMEQDSADFANMYNSVNSMISSFSVGA